MKRGKVVGLGMMAGVAICSLSGLKAQQPGAVDVSGYPAEVQKQYKLFSTKCSRCHDLSRALTAKYVGEAQWRDLVDRMARKPGANLSRPDQAQISAFLVYYQQARTGGKARPAAPATGGGSGSGGVAGYPPEMQKRYKVFAEKCSRCHDLSRPLTAKYTGETQWRDLVVRMARKPGAGINRRDVNEITTFLVFHEKAGTGAPTAAASATMAEAGTETGGQVASQAGAAASEGGLRIEAETLASQPITVPADGQWVTEAPAEGENRLLVVRLYDQATGEKLPYATIRARLGGDGAPAAKTLRPLFGDRGFYYAANVTAPAGDIPLTLEVEPPALGRVHDQGQRWMGPVTFKLTVRGQ